MNNSLVLHHSDFVYTRMKAHAWRANRTLYPTLLQADAGAAIAEIVERVEPLKAFVINCQGMAEIDDHAISKMASAQKKSGRQLVFLNASQFVESLSKALGRYNASYLTPDSSVVYIFGTAHLSQLDALQTERDSSALELSHIRKLVANCFRPHASPQRLSSTPLLSTGVFNARALITDPDVFVWPCLLMAEYVDNIMETAKPPNPRILAVSLRGGPFAAAVRLIGRADLPIEIVDHMGPKHKILEEHSLKGPSHSVNYIFVGDFIVGGTELRIAEAYAYRNASVLRHAIVLGCALPPACYSSNVAIKSLTGVLQDSCPQARFVFNEGDLK